MGCDQLLRNNVNCTDVFTTGVNALDAVSRAAYSHRHFAGATLFTGTGAVSAEHYRGRPWDAESQAALTINTSVGNFITVGNVSTGTLGAATAQPLNRLPSAAERSALR